MKGEKVCASVPACMHVCVCVYCVSLTLYVCCITLCVCVFAYLFVCLYVMCLDVQAYDVLVRGCVSVQVVSHPCVRN